KFPVTPLLSTLMAARESASAAQRFQPVGVVVQPSASKLELTTTLTGEGSVNTDTVDSKWPSKSNSVMLSQGLDSHPVSLLYCLPASVPQFAPSTGSQVGSHQKMPRPRPSGTSFTISFRSRKNAVCPATVAG